MDRLKNKANCSMSELGPQPVEGEFSIRYRDNDDEPWVVHLQKKNLIVNSARKVMARALGGDTGASWYVNQLKIGGDATLTAAELLAPNSPTATDTDIVYTANTFTRNSTDTVAGVGAAAWTVSYPDFPNETSVLFSIVIGKIEANLLDPNPTPYLSAGLYADGGNYMFASQSFPALVKTPERELLIEWTIRF